MKGVGQVSKQRPKRRKTQKKTKSVDNTNNGWDFDFELPPPVLCAPDPEPEIPPVLCAPTTQPKVVRGGGADRRSESVKPAEDAKKQPKKRKRESNGWYEKRKKISTRKAVKIIRERPPKSEGRRGEPRRGVTEGSCRQARLATLERANLNQAVLPEWIGFEAYLAASSAAASASGEPTATGSSSSSLAWMVSPTEVVVERPPYGSGRMIWEPRTQAANAEGGHADDAQNTNNTTGEGIRGEESFGGSEECYMRLSHDMEALVVLSNNGYDVGRAAVEYERQVNVARRSFAIDAQTFCNFMRKMRTKNLEEIADRMQIPMKRVVSLYYNLKYTGKLPGKSADNADLTDRRLRSMARDLTHTRNE